MQHCESLVHFTVTDFEFDTKIMETETLSNT